MSLLLLFGVQGEGGSTPYVPWPPNDVAEGYQAGRYGLHINLTARIADLQGAGQPTAELQKILDLLPTPPVQ